MWLNDLAGYLTIGMILLGPLLLPLLLKKWQWMKVAAVGYVLYICWGLYLHFNADIQDYGTGYGMLILPYLVIITVIGLVVERGYAKSVERKKRNV